MQKVFLFALLITAAQSVFAGKLYKSVDENGVVTYSQTRPAAAQSTTTMNVDAELGAAQKQEAEAGSKALRESLQPPGDETSQAQSENDAEPPKDPRAELRHAQDELRRARVAYQQALNSKKSYSERRVQLALQVVKERERRVKELKGKAN